MKLNIGCGRDSRGGYVNLDLVHLPGVDVVSDLNSGNLPFKENSFEEVYCRHVLEHLEAFTCVVEDIVRILKSGGKLQVEAPHCSGPAAYSDPTHRVFFSYNTFRYFTEGYVFNFYSKARLRIVNTKLVFATGKLKYLNPLLNPILNLFPNYYERFFMWALPVEAVIYILKVIK